MSIHELLIKAVEHNASDIHLSSFMPPMWRIDGEIQPMDFHALSYDELKIFANNIMTDHAKQQFETQWETDFSYELPEVSRFRVNIFRQKLGISLALRIIPSKIITLDELNMPAVIKKIALFQQGLVLITGPTGSGKSTTLAAIVHFINTHTQKHIITIEDPIEFLHQSQHCLISQRELHRDTQQFSTALRSALREDPDVILVGELRDLETIRLAVTAAETGHLVLGTLHTRSAEKTIHRLIDVFPGEEKNTIRSMLSESLEAVVAQTLVKREGGGRLATIEIMLSTPAIRHLIRENKIAQMASAIQTGQSIGMQTREQHMEKLAQEGLIIKN